MNCPNCNSEDYFVGVFGPNCANSQCSTAGDKKVVTEKEYKHSIVYVSRNVHVWCRDCAVGRLLAAILGGTEMSTKEAEQKFGAKCCDNCCVNFETGKGRT